MLKQKKEKSEVEQVVDWSELQPELIDSIAKKLTEYADYVKFRAVCVKWRSVVSPKPHQLPVQLPWLMLTYPAIENFFSLSENKIHRLNLPEIHSETRCCWSSLGWIVLVDKTPNVLLFNPITRMQFQLPPLTTFPNVLGYDVHNIGKEYIIDYPLVGQQRRTSSSIRDCFIKKVVLSSSPSSPKNKDFVAVAIFMAGQLAFCKKGDESWTVIDDAPSFCEDVIIYNGLFYAINHDGSIAICDVSGLSPLVTIIEPSLPTSQYSSFYLVDSFGELLLVARHRGLEHDPELHCIFSKTLGFDVFRLDSSIPSCVAVESLGDRMLFLGRNSSLCLLATDFSGCQGNHIYFTSDGNTFLDSGVFNVGDGSIDPLPHSPVHITLPHCPIQSTLPHSPVRTKLILPPPPIWVTPNPC